MGKHHVWKWTVLLAFFKRVDQERQIGSVKGKNSIIMVFLKTSKASLYQLEPLIIY
jgi:hypothetical protein